MCGGRDLVRTRVGAFGGCLVECMCDSGAVTKLTVFKSTLLPERKLVESSRKVPSRSKPMSVLRSLEEKYVVAMKKLQFGEFQRFCFTLFTALSVIGSHLDLCVYDKGT